MTQACGQYYVMGAPWAIRDYPRFPHRELLLDSSRCCRLLDTFHMLCVWLHCWHQVHVRAFSMLFVPKPALNNRCHTPAAGGKPAVCKTLTLVLGVCRHFLSVAVLKRIVDALTFVKINVLHWHIVDNQSFPSKQTLITAQSLSQSDMILRLCSWHVHLDKACIFPFRRGAALVNMSVS